MRFTIVLAIITPVVLGSGCASVKSPESTAATTRPLAKTDDASARIDQLDARVSRLWASRNRRTVIETVHVQFRPDREELDEAAQAALGALVDEMNRNEDIVADLEGYTDTTGTRDHNLELSRRRAEAVRLYLVEHGVELSRVHAIGRGPLTDAAIPADRKRRVTIKLLAPSE